MGYRINVSLNNQHFFNTEAQTLQGPYKARQVLKELIARFPEHEGYKVQIQQQETVGRYVDIAEFLSEGE